ncbi:M56 family metallopeptidase [Edaphobacter aggregans]|uniref:M56 family metallopeptidase n=1 Tax=Edaphobacter aggregans TaxID=570835 RepID=UPI0005512E78|nr:M56 family metallopeptidase [Edaphobacter aggregans]
MNDSMQALGWTLVHFCWQAAAIALLYRILDLALSRSRSSVRYALALAAMMGMFAVSLVTLGYEEMRLTGSSAFPLGAQRPVATPMQSTLAPVISDHTAPTPEANPWWRLDLFLRRFVPMSLPRLMPWIDAMWLLGVMILSLRTVGGWMMIRRLRMSALVEIPDAVRTAFDSLSRRMGIRRHIDLFVCERISGPLAMGVFRSVVLLPVSALTHLGPDQLEVVLAHELAHIRRGDYLWNMLQTVVETLFFFHPAVWWLGGHLRQQRELCCDDVALGCCTDPIVYATALLRLDEQRSSRLQLAMALDGHTAGLGLKARIVRILEGSKGDAPLGRELAPLSLVGVSAVLGLFLLPLPNVFADHAKPAELLAAAAIYPAPRSHVVAGANDVKCAPKSAFTLKAPPAPKALPAVPIAPNKALSGVRPVPEPAPLPVVAVAPQAPPVAALSAPPLVPAVGPAPELSLHVISQLRDVLPHRAAMSLMIAQRSPERAQAKSDYISEMRAAGYEADLDKLVAMKIQGVTPEYAHSMAQLGYGKPTADELVSLKIFGVSPETVSKLRAAGIAPTTFRDLISYQIFKVTPEFVAAMKDAGFAAIPTNKLIALRVQNVTPEFAKSARQQYPDITVDQLVQLRIFHIDQAFIASAKSHGFDQLTIDKLIKLRISGLLDEGGQKSENK